MSAYLKTIVAVLTGISTWGVTAVADGHITAAEYFGLLGVIAVGLGVYGAKNRPTGRTAQHITVTGVDPAKVAQTVHRTLKALKQPPAAEPPDDGGHSTLQCCLLALVLICGVALIGIAFTLPV